MNGTDLDTLELDIATALERAKSFRVTDGETRLKASESRQRIKQWEKAVEDKYGPEKLELYRPYKAKLDEIKELTDILKKLDAIFKSAIQSYDAERERTLQEEARIALEAMKSNAPRSPIVEFPPDAPKATGEYTVEVWEFEVTDFSAIPDDYKLVNDALLRSVVRERKGLTTIPGIKVIARKDVRQRA